MDEILFLLIFGIIMLAALMLIGLPLIREGKSAGIYNKRDEFTNSKDTVLATINEIEFDYQMGKLAKDDYLYLKNHYESMAIKLLRENDDQELNKSEDLLKAIEKEIESELEIVDNSPTGEVGR